MRLLGRPRRQDTSVALAAEIGALPPVVADARSLKQVLINLISNALKFTVAGGAVRVMAAAEPEGGVVLAVTDTGVGMTPAELAQALEPFGQVRRRAPEETQGHRAGPAAGESDGRGQRLRLRDFQRAEPGHADPARVPAYAGVGGR